MRARRATRVLLLAACVGRAAPAALLERGGGLRSRLSGTLEQATSLLPKGGPGLLGLDDASISEQAPGMEPDAVLTPSQAIKGLYRAFNERDADAVASFLTEDCVYEDLLLGPSTVCRGREAFVNALRFHPAFLSNKLFKDNAFGGLFPDVVIEVDSVAEGVDTVGSVNTSRPKPPPRSRSAPACRPLPCVTLVGLLRSRLRASLPSQSGVARAGQG